MIIYTVQPRDTVYSIGKKFNIPFELIIQSNQLSDPDHLVVGQTLVIGNPMITHTVKENETLYSIARSYNTTVNRILRNNPHLGGECTISVNDILVISYDDHGRPCIIVHGNTYPSVNASVLDQTLPNLTDITPFSYGFRADGSLVGLGDDVIVESAKTMGVSPVMNLSNLNNEGAFDNALTHMLLNSTEMQDSLIEQIINNMILKQYRKLNVDFEYIYPEDKDAYINFINKIKTAFAPYRFELWVSLAPKINANDTSPLAAAHDYSRLGEIADRLLLMTYEWGYRYGNNSPVAPIGKLEQVVNYAISEIPPEKLLLGVPNYGYDFSLSSDDDPQNIRLLSGAEALKLAWNKKASIEYDTEAQAPYFQYYENGIEHKVWFEDARSVQAKLYLVDRNNLAGISIWNLMEYFPQLFFLLLPYCTQ